MTDTPNTPDYFNHNLLNEECMPLSQAARRLPRVRGKKPPAAATLARWSLKGLRTKKSGERVLLETIPIGGTTCTSIEALTRFFARIDDVEREAPRLTPKQEETAAKKRNDQAMQILRQRGIAK